MDVEKKEKVLQGIDPFIVTPSRWLATCFSLQLAPSPVERTEVIPNGLDVTIYKPVDRTFARELINLDPLKKIILMGA